MEFDDIRAFVAVAEARSVSRAARALYLTQPAVTRRMQRLESALGVTLCDRTRRPGGQTPSAIGGQTPFDRVVDLSDESLVGLVAGSVSTESMESDPARRAGAAPVSPCLSLLEHGMDP